MPLGNDPDAIARVLWELTVIQTRFTRLFESENEYGGAFGEKDKSADFSEEKPQDHKDVNLPKFPFDTHSWEDRLHQLSAEFRKYPDVYSSTVVLSISKSEMSYVSTEGSAVRHRRR